MRGPERRESLGLGRVVCGFLRRPKVGAVAGTMRVDFSDDKEAFYGWGSTG